MRIIGWMLNVRWTIAIAVMVLLTQSPASYVIAGALLDFMHFLFSDDKEEE